jgi:YVTN family beta-propeller protein
MWKLALVALLALGAPQRSVRSPRAVALILHKRAQSLGAYDLDTGHKLNAPIALGPKPHEMVASSDGKHLYVTNYGVDHFSDVAAGASSISVVNLAAFKSEPAIDLGRYHRPHGIERGHSGRLYLTTDFPPAVLIVDPDARKIVAVCELDQSLPHMLALSANEQRIYVANAGSGTVTALVIGPQGERRATTTIKVGGVPMGVALSSDERSLYVATRDGDQVVVVDTATSRVRATVPMPGHPARVRLTAAGRYLIATLIEAGDVAVIDTRSLKLEHRFGVGAHAEGLTLDAIGGFGYVAVQGENKVVKFSLADWKPALEIKTAAGPDPIVILR